MNNAAFYFGGVKVTYTIKKEIYCNKISGQILIFSPWFTTIEENKDAQIIMKMGEDKNGVNFFYGAFYQCGWLIENEHGVIFGANLSVIDNFEYIGEL